MVSQPLTTPWRREYPIMSTGRAQSARHCPDLDSYVTKPEQLGVGSLHPQGKEQRLMWWYLVKLLIHGQSRE